MDVGDMVDARYLVMLFWDSWGSDIRTVVSDRCVKYGKVVVSSSLSRGRILRYACRKHYLNIEANARPTRTMIGSRSVIGEISMGFATFWEDDLECSFGTCTRSSRSCGWGSSGWHCEARVTCKTRGSRSSVGRDGVMPAKRDSPNRRRSIAVPDQNKPAFISRSKRR